MNHVLVRLTENDLKVLQEIIQHYYNCEDVSDRAYTRFTSFIKRVNQQIPEPQSGSVTRRIKFRPFSRTETSKEALGP